MKLHLHFCRKISRSRQDGYILIVLLLFLTLLAIGLTAVAPAIAQQGRREQEIELIHRGKQYARAIRLYYRKFGRYPVRLEELENTNRLRFLRKRYKDPMTLSGEWRLIHYGEAQLTPPNPSSVLPGATTPGAGATPGVAGLSSAASSPFASTFSLSSQTGSGQASTTPGQTGTTPGQTGTSQGQAGTTQGASSESSQSGQSSGQAGQSGTPASQISSPLGGGATFGGGPVVGVASTSKKQSIKELNLKNHYNDWEFVYDPRLDLTTTAQPQAGVAGQNPLAPGAQAPGIRPTTGSTGVPGGSQPTAPVRSQ
jgi:type II secretory pathway pseudopilin PulG